MELNDKKNFIYKSTFFDDKYYTLSELLEIKNAVLNTIEKYKKNNLNDDIIKHLNSQKHTKEFIPKKIVKGLYLINQDDKFLKIGFATDVNKRLKQIKTSNPNKVEVLFFIKGLSKIEKTVHLFFDNLLHENEWFIYDQKIISLFSVLLSKEKEFKKLESKEDLIYLFNKITKL